MRLDLQFPNGFFHRKAPAKSAEEQLNDLPQMRRSWLPDKGRKSYYLNSPAQNRSRIQLVSAISVCVERNPVSLHKISWGV